MGLGYVDRCLTVHRTVAGRRHLRAAVAAIDAVPAIQEIITILADELVVARYRVHLVVAPAATDDVVTFFTADDVVAIQTRDYVGPPSAIQGVAAARADDRGCPAGAACSSRDSVIVGDAQSRRIAGAQGCSTVWIAQRQVGCLTTLDIGIVDD